MPTEGFVTTRDLRLHYLEWNAAGQDTILMLHGLRGEASIWATVAEPSRRRTSALLATLPTARAVEIPNAGHSIHVDNLPDVMAAVTPFVTNVKRAHGAAASAQQP